MTFIKVHLVWIVISLVFVIGFSVQAIMWFNLDSRATQDRTAIINIANFIQQATQPK